MDMITTTPTEQRKNFVDILTEWLRKWARVFSIDRREPIVLSEQDFAIYGEALAHLTPEQLDGACLRAHQACKWFPKPADILEHVKKAGDGALDFEAQQEWEKALDYSTNHWHPDVGVSSHAPQLSPATWNALNAAGGLSHLFNCSRDELQWARKRFIENYKLTHNTDKVRSLLPESETKRIVSRLLAGPPALRPANPDWEKKYPPPAPPQNVPRLAVLKDPPEPYRALTEEEWVRRKQEQRDRIASWVAEHPELHSK
jgi:hypothetical protein